MAEPHAKHGASEGFEQTDAKPKPLLIFTAVLTVICLVSFLLMALMFQWMRGLEEAADVPTGYVRDDRWKAPDVQLEVHPSRLREQLEKKEREELTTYAWIDQSAGKVRIPVERAIELLAAKGLPHRTDLDPAQEGSPSLTESGGTQKFQYGSS